MNAEPHRCLRVVPFIRHRLPSAVSRGIGSPRCRAKGLLGSSPSSLPAACTPFNFGQMVERITIDSRRLQQIRGETSGWEDCHCYLLSIRGQRYGVTACLKKDGVPIEKSMRVLEPVRNGRANNYSSRFIAIFADCKAYAPIIISFVRSF